MLSLSRFTAVAGLLTAICAAPLSGQAANASDRVQYVKVIARDYVYDAPASVQAGIAVIHLLDLDSKWHETKYQFVLFVVLIVASLVGAAMLLGRHAQKGWWLALGCSAATLVACRE